MASRTRDCQASGRTHKSRCTVLPRWWRTPPHSYLQLQNQGEPTKHNSCVNTNKRGGGGTEIQIIIYDIYVDMESITVKKKNNFYFCLAKHFI